MKKMLVLALLPMLSGCLMADRMNQVGFPRAYSNGYAHGRGEFMPLAFHDDNQTYRDGLRDGEADRAAGVKGDPPAPKFTPR